ncbi:glycosyltransferase [Solidesulfovibrio sp.]|uniref:glycosyltransferase family 2 protein n=1 Tax=Solidesulfovibrio sp. TaxID=2910990 RepID=UPI00262D9489|nr:glycosyltransferase [Solidesulfovibrio sp.]
MNAPKVSVVLPVYNGALYLRAAVESILSQTFGDFECIIIDDGSRDESYAVAAAIDDPRIRLLRQENTGLAATLNRGISLARGPYIARQDQDDLSDPCRLERQVAFMDAHPDCVLLGTRAIITVDDAPTGRFHDHPVDTAILRLDLLFNNPFVHSSVMLRRDMVLAAGGYTTDPDRQPPEDYELWSRLARRHAVANLPERLVHYREVSGSMSRAGANPFLDKLLRISAENIALAAGLADVPRPAADAAALIHAAPSRLSPQANITAILKLVRRAAGGIDPDRRNPALWAKLEWYCDNLAHHYVRATGRPAPPGRGAWAVFWRRALSRKTWRRLLGLAPQ